MNKDQMLDIVKHYTREVLPDLEPNEFGPAVRFADLGANSVDRAEILMLVMESLSLNIPRLALFGTRNIGELVDVLYEKCRSV